MNAAGIDVSSRKSTVAVLRPFGEVVRVPFEVSHSAEGLASLVQQLKAIEGDTRVVMQVSSSVPSIHCSSRSMAVILCARLKPTKQTL